ncbi:phosphatidylinositol 4-kinase alpha 1 [Selaginella moellendorffii]|uniref:phosphatidylinositol 4-kinase alpha 1 n=1 Tax=Selaginella moellendorffii TaxID=88036 RepID=UPI000D1C6BEE|nr:phosphatidylinositol 4-kinase alpha 1 [Selaginella moellendorffii]|eukprot:XP_024530657.1 phosphatidylinositol 4-kinase alpha 1 [Selaginella moellendorffii]
MGVGLEAVRRLSDVLARQKAGMEDRLDLLIDQKRGLHGIVAASRYLAARTSVTGSDKQRDLLLYVAGFIDQLPAMAMQAIGSSEADFFAELARYLVSIVEKWPVACSTLSKSLAIVLEGFDPSQGATSPCRAFLCAVSMNCFRVDEAAVDQIGDCLLRKWIISSDEDSSSPRGNESIDDLERYKIGLRLFINIMGKSKDAQVLKLRSASVRQLKTLIPLLKIRKRELNGGEVPLKQTICLKMEVAQVAAILQTKSLLSSRNSSDGLVWETVTLLMDVADSCVTSPWRRIQACEVLFESLLSSVAEIVSAHGNRTILHRLRLLILCTCAYADTWGTNQGALFKSVVRSTCSIIQAGWNEDRSAVESFLLSLAAHVRQHSEQEDKEKPTVAVMQLNVIPLLAEIAAMLNKSEAVDMLMPMFIECLEEGEASAPSLLRLRLLDAVARMAGLGFEKSYREAIALLTKSYKDKLSTVGSTHSRTLAPEATTERVETLPLAFYVIAGGLKDHVLRNDYRQRLLILCSEVGLVAEAKSGRSGADLLGPLLPAVAEICSDFQPSRAVEPSLLKLFRNLWFYIVLFGLAPPIQREQSSLKSYAISTSSMGSMSAMALQAVAGPYLWNAQWSAAVQRLTEATPPLLVSSVKWMEDELELNALHNPGSRRGSGNEKAVTAQRAALAASLGGRVEISSLSTISGVKATYLLAVSFLEVLRFSCNGGILRTQNPETRSSLICTFMYLETPQLTPDVYQCLSAMVHRAFDAAITWLCDKATASEDEKDSVLMAHATFLIQQLTHRNENIREMADSLLSQLRNRFPQVLWNPRCVDLLLNLLGGISSSALASDPGAMVACRMLVQQRVREWITYSLLLAPATTQGLLEEQFRKLKKTAHTSELIILFSDLHLDVTKMDMSGQAAIIPAVTAAAAAAAGANSTTVEVLSTGVISANVKSNYVGEIVGMKKLYAGININQLQDTKALTAVWLSSKVDGKSSPEEEDASLSALLFSRFLLCLQQFVTAAERGESVDAAEYHEACLRATALLLSDMALCRMTTSESFVQLLRLLCWCPAYIFTPAAMETGIFVWSWLLSAAPQLRCSLLSELVDAWLWTVDTSHGLFGAENCGPAAKLRPHLTPGEPVTVKDSIEGILAHRLWLGFLLDRFEVVKHNSRKELLLIGRLLQGSVKKPRFTSHPAATGTFFTLMLLGFKFCAWQLQNLQSIETAGIFLLEDRIYRSALSWFAAEPGWYDWKTEGDAQSEAQAVSTFVYYLTSYQHEPSENLKSGTQENGYISNFRNVQLDGKHGQTGKERVKQLLLMLSQHEADRLETWAFPLKDFVPRLRVHADRLLEFAKTAWLIDPRIALSLVARFPAFNNLRSEVAVMVQEHLTELREIPEALPYFVTPKAVDENSPSLQQLPHWALCSITRALEFLTPPYKGHHRVMAYVLRVMESYPPERVTFFMPQLVQALRYDDGGLVEGYLMVAAKRSNLFAHILIWELQGEEVPTEELNKDAKDSLGPKGVPLSEIVPRVKQRIIDSFTAETYDIFIREFRFFDQVTSISGFLYPLPKEERRGAIRQQLEKIEVTGDDLYLPTAPNKLVRSIQLDSGIPLQSAAKVPIMITFNVVDKEGDSKDIIQQACIFKVGDDCRQDVLALQVIALLRDIFQAVGLDLYVFPYGVLPTGYGRGIIEVVPNTRSRNQMGEISDGGLYELFQQDYGPVGSVRFEAARDKFIVSSAGYAVASLLLQPKDRHNGNLLFDNEGRLVHIDFGFILETSPGGNLRFESAQFKLSHEMTQLIDPSGVMRSETWNRFVSLCVKGYLAARQHMDGIVNTVLLMIDSGLPCFSRGDPIGNLRRRFHPDMTEREAANFMIRTCADAYNKWSTAGYDLIQYLQQGIEK